MKKFFASLVCMLSIFAFNLSVVAAEDDNTDAASPQNKVGVYVFTREACGYCEKAIDFFTELQSDKEYGKMFELHEIQVYDSSWNVVDEDGQKLLDAVTEKFGDTFSGTPYMVIANESFDEGYQESMNKDIKKLIKDAYESEDYVDPVANIDLPIEEEDSDTAKKVILYTSFVVIIAGAVALVVFARKANK